jgi:Protein tyrosine and serine/threonine kinase
MREHASSPDVGGLGRLAERYEILGELRGSVVARRLIGRRRDDGLEVMIVTVDAAHGGDNNALAHFASDAQILTRASHPLILQVLEGQWLGADAYAVVSERVHGPTLHEVLSSGERLPNPRIATMLHDVNDALGWARNQGVVHRGVSTDAIVFDQETQRLHVLFELTPISLERLPDVLDDARTIGRLAWSMLTGQTYDSTFLYLLGERRRDLARHVVDETIAMVDYPIHGDPPDVERFLSVIARGEVLREGELEMAQLQAELIEERRTERIRLEAEARASADHAEAMEARLRKERAEFEKHIAREERRIASDQQQVAAERGQLDQERLEFARRVTALERRRAEVERLGAASAAVSAANLPDEDDLLGGGSRFGWILPVATVAGLVLMITFGALLGHNARTTPRAINVGTSTIVPTEPRTRAGVLPKGGFLNQSGGGIERPARPVPRADTAFRRERDTTVRRDTSVRRDTIFRDSIARTPPDTVALPPR